MSSQAFDAGRGASRRQSHHPGQPVTTSERGSAIRSGPGAGVRADFPVHATRFVAPNWPFQPLPPPNGISPFRYDLSRLLVADDIDKIRQAGVMVVHTVGDTGDYRGRQQDFVAGLMTADAEALPDGQKPAFFYHLGDVVYFAGDVNMYGDNFYETYKSYPAFIVSIPGNHDCQPDDSQDGPVDPNKVPLDGWVQNFMSKDPTRLGSLKTGAGRTQLDLPNPYWTFTTPFATFIGLFSNVGEDEAEFHQDQIDWFRGELAAADKNLALVVAVHHPPFSGDTERSGSSVAYNTLFDGFAATGRYPDLILSGHVHLYQRFTATVDAGDGKREIPCIVAGNGGYTNLGHLRKINGNYPTVPLELGPSLRLDQYDTRNFGFLRLEISKTKIVGTYLSAPYSPNGETNAAVHDTFEVDLTAKTVGTPPAHHPPHGHRSN